MFYSQTLLTSEQSRLPPRPQATGFLPMPLLDLERGLVLPESSQFLICSESPESTSTPFPTQGDVLRYLLEGVVPTATLALASGRTRCPKEPRQSWHSGNPTSV